MDFDFVELESESGGVDAHQQQQQFPKGAAVDEDAASFPKEEAAEMGDETPLLWDGQQQTLASDSSSPLREPNKNLVMEEDSSSTEEHHEEEEGMYAADEESLCASSSAEEPEPGKPSAQNASCHRCHWECVRAFLWHPIGGHWWLPRWTAVLAVLLSIPVAFHFGSLPFQDTQPTATSNSDMAVLEMTQPVQVQENDMEHLVAVDVVQEHDLTWMRCQDVKAKRACNFLLQQWKNAEMVGEQVGSAVARQFPEQLGAWKRWWLDSSAEPVAALLDWTVVGWTTDGLEEDSSSQD